MGRASYQHIDNIIIGDKKAVCLTLIKKNHKKVTVCLVATGATFSPQSATYSPAKPMRPVLHLKK